MISIPLVNAPIGQSGVNFTPDKFPEWVAFIKPQLEGIESGGGGVSPLITGSGRIAGADYFTTDATKPAVPSTPSLTIELQNGTYLIEGSYIVIDEEDGFLAVSGIPANLAGFYGHASKYLIEDSGGQYGIEFLPENWYATPQPDLSAAGLYCVGAVTSDTDSVNSINPAREDVIVPLTVFLKQLKALGGDGSEAPDDAVTQAQLSVVIARQNEQDAEIEELRALIAVQGGADPDGPNDLDQTNDAVNGLAAGLAEVNAHSVERNQISVIVKGSGLGQDSTPNYSPATGDPNELPWDETTGTFGT